MNKEISPNVLVSNMAMPYLAALPVEASAKFATRYMKAGGIEYVPTKWGVLQASRGLSNFKGTEALHWNWRSEPKGWKGFLEVVNSSQNGVGRLVASAGTFVLMPERSNTKEHLLDVQNAVGKNLPLVFSEHDTFVYTDEFADRSIQITADFLDSHAIRTPEQLEKQMKNWELTPCIDTAKIGGISPLILRKALNMAHEIHIGINRVDLDNPSLGFDLSITDPDITPNLRRVVVEGTLVSPALIKNVVWNIKDRLKNR